MSSMTAGVTRPPALRMTGASPSCEPEDDGRVDPVVEAGDDDHRYGGQAERRRGVGTGELRVALEQGDQLGHWMFSFERSGTAPTP